MVVTAETIAPDAMVHFGTLVAEEGENILLSGDLKTGRIKTEVLQIWETQDMPDISDEPIITADLANTDSFSGTVPAGEYSIRLTCLEKASGSIAIELSPA